MRHRLIRIGCVSALRRLEGADTGLLQPLAQAPHFRVAEECLQPFGVLRAHAGLAQPLVSIACLQAGPVICSADFQAGRRTEGLQPLLQGALPGLGKGLLQLPGALRTDTGQLLQVLAVERQPVEQVLELLTRQQRAPGARTDAGQVQSLFAGEPVQACEKLLPAVGARLPAAQRMVLLGVGYMHRRAFRAAPDHLIEARNGQAGQAYRYLIAGAYIQRLPGVQRAERDAADTALVEVDRLQAQHRRDASRAADVELHRLNHGQGLAGRVFPGNCPVRRLGLPACAMRPCALAQYHAIAGERLRFVEPALAPVAGLLRVFQRLGVVQAVGEAEPVRLCENLAV